MAIEEELIPPLPEKVIMTKRKRMLDNSVNIFKHSKETFKNAVSVGRIIIAEQRPFWY